MIIDAHHHLWNYKPKDYPWMDDSMEVLKRDYLPGDLAGEMEKEGVIGTVVVQARQSLEETRWLLEQAESNDFIKGVVGWVDLQSDSLNDELSEFASHPKFVGVRHVIHDEPDDNFMLRPNFMRGIEQLNNYNLSYDLLLFPKHLENALELVNRFPDQKFVLDHISKPKIKSGIMDPWRDDISSLAAQPNVWCKVSGLVTEADFVNWKEEDFSPYLEVIFESFGVDRIMIGSDWPVCRLAGEYKDVMSISKKFFDTVDDAGLEKIFKLNAIEFYELKL